jgi:hypothetical protein
MDITDETLNCFIDGELPPLEMSIVRDAIASSEAIALRVDALASINSQVHASLHEIDAMPLSAGLDSLRKQLETNAREEHSNNVVSFPWWRKARAGAFLPSAVAASVATIFVFFVGLGPDTETGTHALPEWVAINQALSSQPSGDVITTEGGTNFEARLTFLNHAGEYCRQFYVKSINMPALQSIACRTGDDWSLRAAMPSGDQASYQTASHDAVLDDVIDAMIYGDMISPAQEQSIIKRRWKPE